MYLVHSSPRGITITVEDYDFFIDREDVLNNSYFTWVEELRNHDWFNKEVELDFIEEYENYDFNQLEEEAEEDY